MEYNCHKCKEKSNCPKCYKINKKSRAIKKAKNCGCKDNQ